MRITSRTIIFEGGRRVEIPLVVGEDLPFTIVDKSKNGSLVRREGVLVVKDRSFYLGKQVARDEPFHSTDRQNSTPG